MARLHPVDVHVGRRVRQRRTLLGMSQTRLADAVGLTFQQVQKYESGFNRISASRLFEFGTILDVPPTHFFEGMGSAAASGKRKPGRPKKVVEGDQNGAIVTKRETLELVRAYYKITDATKRKRIAELVAALGA